jgi:hypothetical protein
MSGRISWKLRVDLARIVSIAERHGDRIGFLQLDSLSGNRTGGDECERGSRNGKYEATARGHGNPCMGVQGNNQGSGASASGSG